MYTASEQTNAVHFFRSSSADLVPTPLPDQALRPIARPPLPPKMRAVLHLQYGPPELLSVTSVARPTPGDDEVLVRVAAAGVSIGDHHVITGTPYVVRLALGGMRKPRNRVPGAAFSGRIEAVGAHVTNLAVGDEVMGKAPNGAYADYVVVAARLVAPKPANLTLVQSAAVPWAITPLQALRDTANVQPGDRVLINGASGGVGSWAIQIAKAFGAHVTAVCSTRNMALVRDLGADDVIDYTRQDFASGGARFDVVFDTVGSRSLVEYRRVLRPEGRFVSCSGGDSSWRWLLGVAHMMLVSWFTRQRLVPFMVRPNPADLVALRALVEAGNAKPALERSYALENIGAALVHVGARRARGQIVVECWK